MFLHYLFLFFKKKNLWVVNLPLENGQNWAKVMNPEVFLPCKKEDYTLMMFHCIQLCSIKEWKKEEGRKKKGLKFRN